MLTMAEGDLLKIAKEDKLDVIVHGCNCMNTMGSGIARTIKERYFGAYVADMATARGDREKLGTYSSWKSEDGFTIVNAYTQYGCSTSARPDVFEYDSFGVILSNLLEQFGGVNYGFPMIGMGLAGGDPTKILPMIEKFSEEVELKGGRVVLVHKYIP